MIDQRFSLGNFKSLQPDSPEFQELLSSLQNEIALELHDFIHTHVQHIQAKLASLGHTLIEFDPEYDPEYASWSYEFSDDANESHPRFHVNTQVCVLSGYSKEESIKFTSA